MGGCRYNAKVLENGVMFQNMLCMTAKNESFQNLYRSKIVGPYVIAIGTPTKTNSIFLSCEYAW